MRSRGQGCLQGDPRGGRDHQGLRNQAPQEGRYPRMGLSHCPLGKGQQYGGIRSVLRRYRSGHIPTQAGRGGAETIRAPSVEHHRVPPDATFAIDRDGHIIAWNRAIEEMTGYTAEMMLGKGNYEYAIPFYGERRPILVDILSFRDDRTAKRYSFIKKDGDTLYTESDMPCVRGRNRVLWGKASPLRDEEDNITGAIESIRDITEQKKTLDALKEREQELTTKSQTLEEVNVALKVLLTQREKDKKELEERFVSNIKQAVLPYILKMQGKGLDTRYKIFLDIITDNLNEIISPFLGTVRQMGFTPKEIEAASLIKKGKTTKELAEFMCISPRTVDTYRDNIRKKLGLSNKKANLRSYLLSFI